MIKSFNELTKDELLAAAEEFGVETDGRKSTKNIIADIIDEGVDVQMYNTSFAPSVDMAQTDPIIPDPEPTAVTASFKGGKNHLLKMERQNPSYEVRGYKFTREHPFAIVNTDEDANAILQMEGFRMAGPAEAESFYSK